ncbi:pilus (MSHA type) biogenesis protein MshL [Desulfovibrio ferrophilus]|nr:pilus (MSHA type) biogenesis protein MshL [Desulfovibrio ferrophilus]
MRRSIVFLGLFVMSLGLAACQNPGKMLESELEYDSLYKQLRKEDEQFVKMRAMEQQIEQSQNEVDDLIEPVLPAYNPLEDTTISISVQQETIHNILYIVARNSGLNLVIEPGIELDKRVTISFEDASSALVVEKLLQAYDLAWEVTENILYVQQFAEQTFKLDFVNAQTEVETNSGGDIFGSALTGSGDLAGQFSMSTAMGGEFDDASLYGQILQSVDSILSEESAFGEQTAAGDEPENPGYFALDPLTGTLYVRSSPGKIKAVAKLLNNLKSKLSKQVVIDARIMEVRLSDNFQFGIDFNWVAERMSLGDGTTTLSLLQRGSTAIGARTFADNQTVATVTGFTRGDDSFNAAIEAMQTFGGVKVVANPHVRAKHAQPALFTSGSSYQYVSEISRDVDDTGAITYTTTTANVFDGVMLGVMAYISDDDKIDMQIFPIKSEVETASLELVEVTNAGDKITLPQVDVKTVNTTVRVKDGDTIILGGLIDKSTSKSDNGIPVMSDIPVLGWLFKTRTDNDAVRELVIVMQVRVVK